MVIHPCSNPALPPETSVRTVTAGVAYPQPTQECAQIRLEFRASTAENSGAPGGTRSRMAGHSTRTAHHALVMGGRQYKTDADASRSRWRGAPPLEIFRQNRPPGPSRTPLRAFSLWGEKAAILPFRYARCSRSVSDGGRNEKGMTSIRHERIRSVPFRAG